MHRDVPAGPTRRRLVVATALVGCAVVLGSLWVGPAGAGTSQETTTTEAPVTTTTEVPVTTTTEAPVTTTSEVPEPVPTTRPVTTAPAPAPSTVPPLTTVSVPGGGVVITEGTVVEPAPDARSGVTAETTTGDDGGGGWLTANTTVRLVSGGLVALAVLVTVLTVAYWRHTRPRAGSAAGPVLPPFAWEDEPEMVNDGVSGAGDAPVGDDDAAEADPVADADDVGHAPPVVEAPPASGIVTVEDLQGPGAAAGDPGR
jgi:hypothetical protein